MRVPVRDMSGETVDQIDLRDDVFAIEPNRAVMHQALVRQLANARLGTHKTKSRSEVRGGGRKPWRQKGTGRARQGSIRAPQWRGGGTVFGPVPRSHGQKMNRKMRRLALRSALSVKAADEHVVVLDSLDVTVPKTREMAALLGRLGIDDTVLILLPGPNPNAEMSARNLAEVKTLRADCLSVRDLLRYHYLIMPRRAVEIVHDILGVERLGGRCVDTRSDAMHVYEVLRRPILTEKSSFNAEALQHYTFEVDVRANKHQIRKAVETIFDVEVLGVNVMNVRGKRRRVGRRTGRARDWKKAIVTLALGDSISFFEGV